MTRNDTTPALTRLSGLSEVASAIRTKWGPLSGADSRAQSTVLGFILVFAILVTFVGFNQAFAVPAENERTEFQHSQDVRDDIVDLRNSSIESSITEQQTVANVRLGTDYPNRILAVNPPEATGTLQTDGGGEIELGGNPEFQNEEIEDLSHVCGTDPNVETSFLQYEANYNEFDSALPITVENSVVHRQNDDQALLDSGQTVIDGNTIWIVRYAGDFRASGSGVESIDLLPSETGQARADGIESLVLPTKLDESDWEALLEERDEDKIHGNGEEVTIELDKDEEFLVRCTTVGINEQPEVSPVQTQFESPTANFNPRGPNSVELTNIDKSDDPDELTFRNRYGFDVTAVEARIPFASASGESLEEDEIRVNDTPVIIGGSPVGLDNPVQIDSEGPEMITANVKGANTQYALELLFVESNTGNPVARNMYFIGEEGGEEGEGGTFEVTITDPSEGKEFDAGEDIEVTADIENTGDEEDTQEVELIVEDEDGEELQGKNPVDDKEITIDSDETVQDISFTWRSNQNQDPGEYTLIVQPEDGTEDQVPIQLEDNGEGQGEGQGED